MRMVLIFNRGTHPRKKISTEAKSISMDCGLLQNSGWRIFGKINRSRLNDKMMDSPNTLKTKILNLDVKLDLTMRNINQMYLINHR